MIGPDHTHPDAAAPDAAPDAAPGPEHDAEHDAELHARRARSFGPVAQQYERYRPGYPPELVDEVLALGGLALGARVLDVGAGTGKGTRLLVDHGLDVTALEPSVDMHAVGRQAVPAARWVLGDLEHGDVEGPFDLLTSAQAWHWTDPATRWHRARALLREGGTLALFWNHGALLGADEAAVLAVYARHAPGVPSNVGAGSDETAAVSQDGGWPADEMRALPWLVDRTVRAYPWRRELGREDYLAFLDTQSPYRVLPDADRQALLDGLAQVLPASVTLRMVTTLHLARVTA